MGTIPPEQRWLFWAVLEVTSVMASTLSGYGTAASFGIDIVIKAKDILPLLKEQGLVGWTILLVEKCCKALLIKLPRLHF